MKPDLTHATWGEEHQQAIRLLSEVGVEIVWYEDAE